MLPWATLKTPDSPDLGSFFIDRIHAPRVHWDQDNGPHGPKGRYMDSVLTIGEFGYCAVLDQEDGDPFFVRVSPWFPSPARATAWCNQFKVHHDRIERNGGWFTIPAPTPFTIRERGGDPFFRAGVLCVGTESDHWFLEVGDRVRILESPQADRFPEVLGREGTIQKIFPSGMMEVEVVFQRVEGKVAQGYLLEFRPEDLALTAKGSEQ